VQRLKTGVAPWSAFSDNLMSLACPRKAVGMAPAQLYNRDEVAAEEQGSPKEVKRMPLLLRLQSNPSALLCAWL